MVKQTIGKPLGLIKDLKILVHGIPCAVTFTIIHCSVLDTNCSMLLGRSWLKDAKVFHDWEDNTITIQGTIMVKIIILVTKKLGTPTKRPKVLICYDCHSIRADEEEDLMFTRKPRLFSIGTIVVPTPIKLEKPISLIPSTSLNLVEQVYITIEPIFVLPILFDKHVKLIFVLLVQIAIPHVTFK
jgi:hypothetical protein